VPRADRLAPGLRFAYVMVDPAMHHIVMTKYNAAMPGRQGARPGLDAGWLQARLDLFSAWTVPSIRRQTQPPDAWLIFVDAETPPAAMERLRQVLDETGRLVPVDGPLTDARVRELLTPFVPAGCRTLCTTRLDNDDAIAATHLARVQDHAAWRGFVNFRNGYQMCRGRIYRRWDSSSPFLSFIEDVSPAAQPTSVFQVPHQHAASVAPIRQISGPPAWLQILHSSNLANEVQGVPVGAAGAARDLGFDPTQGMAHAAPLSLKATVAAMSAQIRHEAHLAYRRLRPS
jgi:hypothetical protein